MFLRTGLRRAGSAILLGLTTISFSAAQEPPAPQDPPRRLRGSERPNRVGRADRPEARNRQGNQSGPGTTAVFDRIAQRLQLTADQRVKWDEQVARFKRELAETGDGIRPGRAGKPDAAKNGDDSAPAEPRARRRDRIPQERIRAFLDEAETYLDESQKDKLGQVVDNLGRRRDGAGPLERLRGLRDRLNLDEKQLTEFDEKLAEFERHQPDPRGRRGEFGRPAAPPPPADGDDPSFEPPPPPPPPGMDDDRPIRRQRRDEAGPRPPLDPGIADFLKDIEPLLNDDQMRILDDQRPRLLGPPPGGRERERLTALRSAIRRLDLTDEQREQFRAIQRATDQQMRGLRDDPEGRAALAGDLEKRVRELLTPEQTEALDRAMTRGDRGGRPGPRP